MKQKVVKNVNCFSIEDELPKSDSRLEKFKMQRQTIGYDETELWNLDSTIVKFIYSRLIGFSKLEHLNDEQKKCVKKLLKKFKPLMDSEFVCTLEGQEAAKKAMKCLSKSMHVLWV